MWKVTLSEIELGTREEEALLRVLRSEWFSLGPETAAFEAEFAEAHAAAHAVAVSSGSAALHLALLAAGVSAGDEVIIPALTFVATAHAVLQCGAMPVFADIQGPLQPTLDPADVRKKLSPKTSAIVPMHYAGSLCDMDGLQRISSESGVPLIEDAAHAAGVAGVGQASQSACFSFYANKNLVAGEGGMVLTDDADRADSLRLLRSHGMTTSGRTRWEGMQHGYDVVAHGFNYRITEFQSALGRAQLTRLRAGSIRRREIAQHYRQLLADVPVMIPFAEPPAHLMVVVLPEAASRDAVRGALAGAGIQTSIHYPPVHRLAAFANFSAPGLPQTESLAPRLLTLPLHAKLSSQDVALVCEKLRQSVAEAGCAR